jgi:hypothetical protein
MDNNYQQWSEMAPRGLMLIGAGASIIAHAASLRSRGKSAWRWVVFGTLGLIALNAGVSVFGEAVKHRTMYESKLGL